MPTTFFSGGDCRLEGGNLGQRHFEDWTRDGHAFLILRL